jgi:hypothetical protein
MRGLASEENRVRESLNGFPLLRQREHDESRAGRK